MRTLAPRARAHVALACALASSCHAPVTPTPRVTAHETAPEVDATTQDAANRAPDVATVQDAGNDAVDAGEAPRATAPGLEDFFAALLRAEAHQPDARVVVMQFGDSHTQGDALTGRVRRRLQARFGDAGRGFLLPGTPIRYYAQDDAEYGESGAWVSEYGMRRSHVPPVGIGGCRVHSDAQSSTVWVATCAHCRAGHRVSRFVIDYGRRADGGTLQYEVDAGAWQSISTRGAAGDNGGAAFETVDVPDGEHRLTLRPAGDGPVDLYGIALERAAQGVQLDSLGVVGAEASHLYNWEWPVLAAQIARRAPKLVVLAYGTNEVVNRHLDLAQFEQQYVELVSRIRAAAPGTSVLILGPLDFGLEDEQHVWSTPHRLLEIIEAERRAAQRTGAAFFDQFDAMGGAGSIDAFLRGDPRRARDHIHLNTRGYVWMADRLLEWLMRDYERYRAQHGPLPAGTEARR